MKDIYDGEGTFDRNGNVNYHASIPQEAHQEVVVTRQFRIDDRNLFVQIRTDQNNDLSRLGNPQMLKINISPIDFIEGINEIDLFLWHDAELVNSVEEASEIMRTKCKPAKEKPNFKNMPLGAPPEKCGNGVLTFV